MTVMLDKLTNAKERWNGLKRLAENEAGANVLDRRDAIEKLQSVVDNTKFKGYNMEVGIREPEASWRR